MIFDIKDAVLIAGGLIIIVFWLIDYAVNHGFLDPDLCDHCFTEYQSSGKRKCIDCGYEEPITKPHYPKHQR